MGRPHTWRRSSSAAILSTVAADLYSLGTVLFELLGGTALRPPLDDVIAVIQRTVATDVPVDEFAASPELRIVIRRATARNPADRYQRPSEMAAALRACGESEPT